MIVSDNLVNVFVKCNTYTLNPNVKFTHIDKFITDSVLSKGFKIYQKSEFT